MLWVAKGNVYRALYDIFPDYSRHYLQDTVSQLKLEGLIEKFNRGGPAQRGGEVVLEVTTKGREEVLKTIPLAKLREEKWDNLWRVVFFDFPEQKRVLRDSFRLMLKNLGFGMLQRSVWATLLPIAEEIRQFVESKGLDDLVLVLEAKEVLGLEDKVLADRVWKLKELSGEFEELVKNFQEAKEELEDPAARRDLNFRFVQRYLALVMQDPHLPAELLLEDWARPKADEVFQTLL